MNPLRSAILGTLSYYDVLDFPLTRLELFDGLFHPHRFHPISTGDISWADYHRELDHLARLGIILEHQGFFVVGKDRLNLINQRLSRQKIAQQKWKRLLRLAQWLQLVPYTRGLLASGSMALNNTDEESDFDILTIAHTGRLYTVRLLLSMMAWLMGSLRVKGDIHAPDKFCFNHYITDRALKIPFPSLYTAQTYQQLKPLWIQDETWSEFLVVNSWMQQYLLHIKPHRWQGRSLSSSSWRLWIGHTFEFILNSALGDWIEKRVQTYQQKRIAENPLTGAPGGRVIFSDTQLEFHPHSFEVTLLQRYNQKLSSLGIRLPEPEQDSGLQ